MGSMDKILKKENLERGSFYFLDERKGLMDDEKTKISKDESVKIPYGLFEKMLNNQKEISKMFCRTIIIIFTILVLFMLVLSIGYFVLWW